MMLAKIIAGLVLIIVGGLMLFDFSVFGSPPTDQQAKGFQSSAQFNTDTGVFQNRLPNAINEGSEDGDTWATLKKLMDKDGDTLPADKLPEVKPNISRFLEPSETLKSIWLGHSTFLLNLKGVIILIDPMFSDYAAPIPLFVKRFQALVLELEELPDIDYIVISHDHYDHLDMKSIKHFIPSKTVFVVPLGVGAHIEGWGIAKQRIVEKDWWQVAEFEDAKFVATPAQHFSGRSFTDRDKTLWASWVIQAGGHNVFYSGDSGFDTHFKGIGERYGPFDVAYMETGQYNEQWKAVHLMPAEAVKAFKDLNAKYYFPVHWGMFRLSVHPWYEPVEKLYANAKQGNIEIIVPKVGQLVNINKPAPLELWWR
ncbi:MAG: MBL fold metallo-hydrolase [Pseudomonadales bacterium]